MADHDGGNRTAPDPSWPFLVQFLVELAVQRGGLPGGWRQHLPLAICRQFELCAVGQPYASVEPEIARQWVRSRCSPTPTPAPRPPQNLAAVTVARVRCPAQRSGAGIDPFLISAHQFSRPGSYVALLAKWCVWGGSAVSQAAPDLYGCALALQRILPDTVEVVPDGLDMYSEGGGSRAGVPG